MVVGTLVMFAAAAMAKNIVIFGDSWGTEGAASFDKMATSHGLTVDNHAVAGSTAQQWALQPNKLAGWVKDNADAQYVWVTIGGNDAEPMLQNGDNVNDITTKIQGWVRKFLDPLYAAVPKIKVVAFGYDILFWDYFECVGTANQVFKRCGKHGQGNFTACANDLFYSLQWAWEELSAEYTKKGFSLTAPRIIGTLQTAGTVPNAAIGKPNNDYFSPSQYTSVTKLCLHANNEGYTYIFDALWDLYFSKHVSTVENPHKAWIRQHGSLEGCCGCDCHCASCGGACPPCATD